MSIESGGDYAGDLLATDAYRVLETDASATLIDVRTQPEWAFVGGPDLSALDKSPLFLEWQKYPSMDIDRNFGPRLTAMLKDAGVAPGAPLLFLCRSGARSRQAAVEMTRAGWTPCFNITDGFEGPLDPRSRRRSVGGWRVSGLPWAQT
jgi:rhodanese-related sulfurtransferase